MTAADPPKSTLSRRLPLLVMLAVALVGGYLLHDKLSFAMLAEHQQKLLAYRDSHYFWCAVSFMAAYALIVAFSLPGASVATLTGGYLFGLFPGVLFNVAGATLGAVAVFSAVRAGAGQETAARIAAKGGAAARLQAALQDNEWSVLFLMRLVPVVPFVLANLIPAFVGVRADRFAITTFLGIIPGALVFTSVGSGLGEVFARGETPDLKVLFTPGVLGPILGLAALSALPIVIKLLRKRA
ncbi:MAG: TVP38/TMEM64 family protein [Paracoccaceae bacterium]